MTYVADTDGAVWALSADGQATLVYDPVWPARTVTPRPLSVETVTAEFGPLTPLPNWPPTLPA